MQKLFSGLPSFANIKNHIFFSKFIDERKYKENNLIDENENIKLKKKKLNRGKLLLYFN